MTKPEGKNRASAEEAGSFVDKFEEFEAQIATEASKHMLACKKIREKQKELLDDAKSQGIPKKVIKALVNRRKWDKKAEEALESLEDDDKDYAVDIYQALGGFADTPLGAAAVERDDTTSAVVDAVRAGMSDEDWNRAGQRAEAAAATH